MRNKLKFWFFGCCLVACASALEFFVSPSGNDAWSGLSAEPNNGDGPLQTIERAQQILREMKNNGSLPDEIIFVSIREGEYRLKNTWSLTNEDSGVGVDKPIIYRKYSPDEEVSIVGSMPLTGWTKAENSLIPDATNVWQTCGDQVREIYEANGEKIFHSLFVNGQRAIRARAPNNGYYLWTSAFTDFTDVYSVVGRQGFYYRGTDLNPSWQNIDEIHITYFNAWVSEHNWIKSINASNKTVYFNTPAAMVPGSFSNSRRYYVENILEELDAPREWYFDKSTMCVYYYPTAFEDMNAVSVEVPILQELVSINDAYNIQFHGLKFAFSDWKIYREDNVTLGGFQSVSQNEILGAINVVGSSSIELDALTVSDVATYAIYVHDCVGVHIRDSHIYDMGAGGIRFGFGVSYSSITNNYIHSGGRLFEAGAGILMQYVYHNVIHNNEISDMYYSGISAGWVWGFEWPSSQNNSIAYNYIHQIGQNVLNDMGGIYTLGPSPNVQIKNNHIHTVYSFNYGGCGVYNDEGSSHIVNSDNFIWDTFGESMLVHYGANLTSKNNILLPGAGLPFMVARNVNDLFDLTIDRNAIIYQGGIMYRVAANAWTSNNNVFLNAGCNSVAFDDLDKDFNAWKGTGKDTSSLLMDFNVEDVLTVEMGNLSVLPVDELNSFGITLPSLESVGLSSEWNQIKQEFKIDSCRPFMEFSFDFDEYVANEAFGGKLIRSYATMSTEGDIVAISDEQSYSGDKSLKFYTTGGYYSSYLLIYPPAQTSGRVTISLDIYFITANSGLHLTLGSNAGPGSIYCTGTTLSSLAGYAPNMNTSPETWYRITVSFEVGDNLYSYTMQDLTNSGQVYSYNVTSDVLCSFREVRIHLASPSGTGFYVDNFSVRAASPTIAIAEADQNSITINYQDQYGSLCGLDVFVDDALFKRYYADELSASGQLNLPLNGVLAGQRSVHAVAKTSRAHSTSNAVTMNIIAPTSPEVKSSPQNEPGQAVSSGILLAVGKQCLAACALLILP